MTRSHLVQSTLAHASLILLYVLFLTFRSTPDIIWLGGEGIDFYGGGGGGQGDGRPKKGVPDKDKLGQVVPQPSKVTVPDKPAPVQKATKKEETWKVKDTPTVVPTKSKPTSTAPVGDQTQKATTNVVRRGKGEGEGEGEAEFGFAGGTGTGPGPGLGIGFGEGPGVGFGWGGYGNILYKRVLQEWLQYATIGSGKSCVIRIVVLKSGAVKRQILEKSSGDAFFDNMAKRAIRNSSPLPPLPPGFPRNQQEFRLQFKLLD